jgi:hypothetical protein
VCRFLLTCLSILQLTGDIPTNLLGELKAQEAEPRSRAV